MVDNSIQIIYGSRDDNHTFHLYTLSWDRNTNEWTDNKIEMPDYSNTLSVLGSGKDEFLERFKQYKNSDIQKTSRAVFQCFCDTLSEIENAYCGGAPQLVGLYQKWMELASGLFSGTKDIFADLRFWKVITST